MLFIEAFQWFWAEEVEALAADGTKKAFSSRLSNLLVEVLVRSAPGSFHADVAEPLCEASTPPPEPFGAF